MSAPDPNATPRLKLATRLARRFGGALARVLAPQCAVCEVEDGDPVCAGCLQDFFDTDGARCSVCGARLVAALLPRGTAARCGRCLAAPPHFDRTLALGDYAPPLDGMITALKSGARLDLARVFGLLLAARAHGLGPFEAVLPVPLDPRRMRERGFNQSQQIAVTLARALAVPVLPGLLLRTRGGPPQQSLPLARRRRNVRGAFELVRRPGLRRLAVVDDVMTSGATLDEIARLLKRAGVEQAFNLVVARTD